MANTFKPNFTGGVGRIGYPPVAGDVEKALELGATTYLVKANYSLEEVIQKIKGTLGE